MAIPFTNPPPEPNAGDPSNINRREVELAKARFAEEHPGEVPIPGQKLKGGGYASPGVIVKQDGQTLAPGARTYQAEIPDSSASTSALTSQTLPGNFDIFNVPVSSGVALKLQGQNPQLMNYNPEQVVYIQGSLQRPQNISYDPFAGKEEVTFFTDTKGNILGEQNALTKTSTLYPNHLGEPTFLKTGITGTSNRSGASFTFEQSGLSFLTNPFVGLGKMSFIGGESMVLAENPLLIPFYKGGKYNALKSYSEFWTDKDIASTKRTLQVFPELGASVLKGIGKQGYFFTDVTTERLIGRKGRDELIPSFSWGEVDRRKSNSWVGFESDPDVQTAGIAELAFGLEAVGGAKGKFLVDVGGITYGLKSISEGYSERSEGKVALGAVMFASSGPLKKIERPFQEIFFEKRAEPVFYDYSGKPYTAKGFEDLKSQFESGKTTITGWDTTTKLEFVHVSPKPFKEYTSENLVKLGSGPKAEAGLEDPLGIFVGPKGAGNPMFSGIPGTASYSRISLNPFTNLFNKPTANIGYAEGAFTLPKDILEMPGFGSPEILAALKPYQFTGELAYTKRGMIGQGVLQRQYFSVLKDIDLSTTSYSAGQIVKEAGTSESEALARGYLRRKVRPDDTLLSRGVGYRQYTRYGALRIPTSMASFKTLLSEGFGGLKTRSDVFEVPLTGSYVRVPEYTLLKFKNLPGRVSNDFTKETTSKSFSDASLGRSSSVERIPVRYSDLFNVSGSSVSKGFSYPKSSLVSRSSDSLGSLSYSIGSSKTSLSSTTSSFRSLVSGSLGSVSQSSFSSSASSVSSNLSSVSSSFSSSKSLSRSFSSSKSLTLSDSFSKSKMLYPSLGTARRVGKKKVKASKRIILPSTGLYALPDLRSIALTELKTGKSYATTPRLVGKTKGLAYNAFKGLGTGFIPTEEIRTKKVKI